MGLLQSLSDILAVAGTLGGLTQQGLSQATIDRLTAPGGLPGTTPRGFNPFGPSDLAGLLGNPYGQSVADLVNRGAHYDPTFTMVPAQLSENQRYLDTIRPLFDQNIAAVQNSGLGGLADQEAANRQQFGQGTNQRTQRLEGVAAQAGQQRNDVIGRLTQRAEAPNVLSQQEVNAVVGAMVGSANRAAAQNAAAAQTAAAGRGAPVSTVNAQTAQAGLQNLANNQQLAAQTVLANADSAERQRSAALDALAALTSGVSPEAQILGMAQQAAGMGQQYGSASIGTEAGIREALLSALTQANAQRAAIEQPIDVLGFGDRLYNVGQANSLLQAGAYQDAASLLSSLGLGGLDTLTTLQAQQMMADAQRDAGESSMFGSALSGLFGGGGYALGGWLGR